MRGATCLPPTYVTRTYFNPRSSCEERPRSISLKAGTRISIHAPHARSDTITMSMTQYNRLFQSTLLMRGATRGQEFFINKFLFQSTLLMRGATAGTVRDNIFDLFQSTLLMRGATMTIMPNSVCPPISIHAPHARSDRATFQQLTSDVISIHAPHARSDRSNQNLHQK